MFFKGELSFNDEVYITNARHKAALEEARESLKLVKNSIDMGMAEDFFSIDLMNAYESLGRIVGESVGEDLVNEIFSKFCTGKIKAIDRRREDKNGGQKTGKKL